MDLAGLRVVMDADFSAVYAAFNQANGMMQDFANNVKNAFNSIPDFKSKFNFTSNGASQAAQDAREYARAAREQAAADLDAAKAKKILEDQQRRNEQATKKEKDAYGQLVADSNALVRAYYNAAAAIIKDGDAAGITAAKLEEMRQAAFDSQEQLKGIEVGAGRFQRNVGNYASAVSGYFGQTLVRTAHAGAEAMIGMQRGVNALAIDLPNLINEFRNMVAEQKAIKASGGEALSITQLLAQAFNPLTLAIQFGVIALVRYGPELYRMATGAEEAKKKAEALKKAQDDLNEAFNSGVREVAGNINQVQALSIAIKDANLPMQTRIDKYNQLIALYPNLFTQINNELGAHDKLNSTYPTLFDNLDNHKGKINALDAAVQNLTKDLYQQAIAQGFSKQLEKLGERTAELKANEVELQKTADSTAKAFEKAAQPYKNFFDQLAGSTSDTKLAKENIDNLNKGFQDLLKNPKAASGITAAVGEVAKSAADAAAKLKDNQEAQKESASKAATIVEAQNKLVESLAKSTTAVTNYKDSIQHEIDAAQKQVDITKAGTEAHRQAVSALQAAQKKMDDYSFSHKKATASAHNLTTALSDLTVKNKEIDAELQIGSTTLKEALKSKINNYQAYILSITKTSKYKVPIDDSRVIEAQKQIGILSGMLLQITHQNKISDIFKGFNSSIQDIEGNELDGTITQLEAVKQEYSTALKAKREFLKEGIKNIGDVAQLAILTNNVKEYSDAVNSETLQEGQKKFNDSLELINQELSAGLITGSEALGNRVNVIKQHLRDLVKAGEQGSQEFQAAMADLNKATADQFKEQFAQNIVSGIESGAETLGTAFGNLINGTQNIGESIGGLFKSLGQILGDQIIALGKQLIITGELMATIKAAIKSLWDSPAAPVVVGLAAIAVGSTLKAALSKQASSVGKFAKGGLIYGQTLGIMGEYAGASSNPEVVAPLSNLTSILRQQNLGGGQQVFIPDMRISGQDLLVVFKRANRSFDR